MPTERTGRRRGDTANPIAREEPRTSSAEVRATTAARALKKAADLINNAALLGLSLATRHSSLSFRSGIVPAPPGQRGRAVT